MVQYGTRWYILIHMVQPCKASTAKGTTEPVARCQQTQVLSALLSTLTLLGTLTLLSTLTLLGTFTKLTIFCF